MEGVAEGRKAALLRWQVGCGVVCRARGQRHSKEEAGQAEALKTDGEWGEWRLCVLQCGVGTWVL